MSTFICVRAKWQNDINNRSYLQKSSSVVSHILKGVYSRYDSNLTAVNYWEVLNANQAGSDFGNIFIIWKFKM
jgi:hypothetical protein